MNAPQPTLGLDGLIRSMGVNRPCRHMLFLGAGASATSGMPTGWQCLWKWKAELYLSAQPHQSALLLGDPTMPHVQRRIQAWLDDKGGFPKQDSDGEYEFYAERCYAFPRDRRKFFEERIARAAPSIGYRLLGLLVEYGHFRWIWTTNFDNLVDRGRASPRARTVRHIGMDSLHRLNQLEPDDDALTEVFLHGDYRYDPLRNTSAELQALDQELRRELVKQCRQYPLVVTGYSGRDNSTMSAFEEAYSQRGDGALFWLDVRGRQPNKRVDALLERARTNGYHAEFIECDGFDPLLLGLSRYLLREGESGHRLEEILKTSKLPRAIFSLDGYSATTEILKSNAWPLKGPQFLYQFHDESISNWAALRTKLERYTGRISAGLKGSVLAMGLRSDLEAAFGAKVVAATQQIEIAPRDLTFEDGVVTSIIREGLVHALATTDLIAVKQGPRWLLVDFTRPIRMIGPDLPVFDAVEIGVGLRAGTLYMSLTPDRFIGRDTTPHDNSELAKYRRELLGKQWNLPFNDEFNRWRERLGLKQQASVVFPQGEPDGFRYTIDAGPVFTQHYERGAGDLQARGKASLYRFRSIELPEPSLRFAKGEDIHPIRGLRQHGPLELAAGSDSRTTELRLGVISLDRAAPRLLRFLEGLTLPHKDVETKAEYLIEYPGFEQAFRLQLRLPRPSEQGWVSLPLSPSGTNAENAFREVLAHITGAIDRLTTGPTIDALLLYIPAEWQWFERVETNSLSLDLHDQIKAYAASRGVRTQLLREQTLLKPQRTEVLWWLALALYAKSLRTPWVLGGTRDDAAYVGIGHSINKRDAVRPIVLGCSHVFQSNGLGLRFQLSQVQNPIWRHKNPFLSRDDALRVGMQTRQLFYESLHRLPTRALVCKRTPFLKDELDGLTQALNGVESVDFLTIEHESSWRYLAYDAPKKSAARFPVKRGTAVLLDDESFFLWLHGSVDRINSKGLTYFQGKTRIPAPVKVRRYGGSSSIEQIGRDLLGLSKMDWNSFDLYEQMPATLSTPGRIARIGQLIQRFGPASFDYRLFM